MKKLFLNAKTKGSITYILLRFLVLVMLLWGFQVSWAETGQATSFLNLQKSTDETAVVSTKHVRAQLVVHAVEGVQVGAPLWFGLLLEHQPGWHTYWKNPGDTGLATELQWQLPEGLQAGDIDWPVPSKFRLGELVNYGYDQTVLLPVPVDITALPKALPGAKQTSFLVQLHAQWLVCKQECIPEQGDFAIQVPIEGSTAFHSEKFNQAFAQRPQKLNAQNSSARVNYENGERLQLKISQLPKELHGTQLEVFSELPEILQHGARANLDWQQYWQEGIWHADVELAKIRQPNPDSLPLVIKPLQINSTSFSHNGSNAWRVDVPVVQGWQSTISKTEEPITTQQTAQSYDEVKTQSDRIKGEQTVQHVQSFGVLQKILYLLLALLGGLLLNLMPCVFPVLAIKVLSMVSYSDNRRAHKQQALAYGFGVVYSFLALGALILVLRSAGASLGWGFQLQSVWFVAAMSLLFTLLGLTLADVTTLRLTFLLNVDPAKRSKSILLNGFLSGVLAVLIAAPCTGPFIGAAIGATLTLSLPLALLIFVFIGIGMALPFMVLVWFPAWLKLLPKPGVWMDVLRKAMAFPMFATVIWLLGVMAQQVGFAGASAWLFALWGLSFMLWLWHNRPQKISHTFVRLVWLLTLFVTIFVCLFATWRFSHVVSEPILPKSVSQQSTSYADAAWQEWSLQAQQQALAQGRTVFVDFTAAWCITCQYNKLTVLSSPDTLAEFAAADVLLLRADWTRQNDEITQALHALNRNGVPTYALHVPEQPVKVFTEILRFKELRRALQELSAARP